MVRRLLGMAKKARNFMPRLRPRQKEVRTLKNPVRVVFVCPFGGSSYAMCNAFLQELEKKGIKSVASGFLASHGKSPSQLRKALEKADFVVPRSEMEMFFRRTIKRAAPHSTRMKPYPNKAIPSSSMQEMLSPMSLDVKAEANRILSAIRKRFILQG